MAAADTLRFSQLSEKEYKRRIWAWTMYDWANSAFVTTIMAAVLPIYFSQVAGSTLPSATVATSYWSYGLSISLLIAAFLAPVLGTVSDVMRGKKLFLSIFAGIGIISAALLVFVESGDWMLASILAIIGRIGFNGANSFYDALLPHVAKEEDRDSVSARGYAMGYLGGGLLLAVNVVMIQLLPGTLGARLSFLSVAIWWAVFSIPLFRRVPEPPSASIESASFAVVMSTSFRRLGETLRDIRQYRELFKFLIAFLIYVDGIGTIIGVAAIYGAELGFGTIELVLALLLVQFVGIPYSLIFGRLPSTTDKRRPFYLAFILFNMVALPLAGIFAARSLPANISGAPPEPYASTASAAGEGLYSSEAAEIQYSGAWQGRTIPASQLGAGQDQVYQFASAPGDSYSFSYNGQKVEITFSMGPDHGMWMVLLDGQPYLDPETGEPLTIDAYHPTIRYETSQTIQAEQPGEHLLEIASLPEKNPQSQGYVISLASIEVLPGIRQSNLGLILGLVVLVEIVGLIFALLFGKILFSGLAQKMNTKRSILLALMVYIIIAVWGFFLDSVVEFWFLAWMVAVVQGGSQALSRSMYAALSPSAKSGEFFGLFGIMEKFSGIVGPLFFATAGTIFGSSRPAVLSLILFFVIGSVLLTFVNVEEGKRIAQAEDAVLLREDLEFE
jgi:UMF1 family MFS transporter